MERVITVKVIVTDSQGQPSFSTTKEIPADDAKKGCIHQSGGFCITPNSSSLCDPLNCRYETPTIRESLR